MKKIHILSPGFTSPNAIAFLFPLFFNLERLKNIGIFFCLFNSINPKIHDCDLLIIDSRFYSKKWTHSNDEKIFDELIKLKEKIGHLVFFDISDSTGWVQSQVLPFVDYYYKSQLHSDLNAYKKSIYGNRFHADYYYKTAGVEDDQSVWSSPVINDSHLKKMKISWNSGLANYSLSGPTLMSFRRLIPINSLLRYPKNFTKTDTQRNLDISCRMGISYPRKTVCHQRIAIKNILMKYLPTDKLSRTKYFQELINSKIVISPFGYGEITLKDFEVFITGGLLLKPDMSSINTYPNFFVNEVTMASHSWDLLDLEEKIDHILSNPTTYQDVAKEGQDIYKHYVASEEGYQEFCNYFQSITKECLGFN
jgi:hypothetical protein